MNNNFAPLKAVSDQLKSKLMRIIQRFYHIIYVELSRAASAAYNSRLDLVIGDHTAFMGFLVFLS